MTRVRVKICGITRAQDAVAAVQSGADAIGMVFYENSPRCITVETAISILRSTPPFVCKVGVFVDPDEKFVRSILQTVPLDLLQFHGSESPEKCRQFNRHYIKALNMADGVDVMEYGKLYHDASGLLLDTHVEGTAGGTGQVFDWNMIPVGVDKPIILAGGLNAANVGDAVCQVRPYAVDVSGGVESGKGIKDKAKMVAFIRAVDKAWEHA